MTVKLKEVPMLSPLEEKICRSLATSGPGVIGTTEKAQAVFQELAKRGIVTLGAAQCGPLGVATGETMATITDAGRQALQLEAPSPEQTPTTRRSMTDSELIDYCDIHSESERALFSGEHINRMLALAGHPKKFVQWVPPSCFLPAHDEMKELVMLARERLASPPEPPVRPLAKVIPFPTHRIKQQNNAGLS